jgi:hypothetical protein
MRFDQHETRRHQTVAARAEDYLTTQHYVMLQRNLVYTGVTRGKRLVVQAELRRPLRRPYRSQATQLGTRDTRPHCNRGTEGSAEELRAEAGRSMDTVAQKPYCKLDVSATLQANMEPSL